MNELVEITKVLSWPVCIVICVLILVKASKKKQ